ncbi:MAG: phosphatase PAP2 family protein [Elusimicrobia bacterium]|jgi:membrane-associated phospholipid phosphatase|nr:phosphatase PAP2 family protein [Elusimicrobiota bacterium]
MKKRLLGRYFLTGILPGLITGPLFAMENTPPSPRPSWMIPAAITGGLLAVAFSLDSEIHHRMMKSSKGELGNFLDGPEFGQPNGRLDFLGRPEFVVVSSGLLYGGGTWAGSDRTKRFAVTLTKATLVSGVAVLGVKFIAGRERPTPENDPDTFHFFQGSSKENVSFPSGHTATAFSWAAATTEEYPSLWVAAMAYGTAGLVGFSRSYQHRHWTSDVVAGAALGYFTGKAVARSEKKKGLLKGLYSDGRGLYWRREF